MKPFLKSNCINCSKSTKNLHFANLSLTLHNENVFAHTTKNSGVFIFYSYRDLVWTKYKFQKCFFWPKIQQLLAKLNFNVLLHDFSRYVIYGNVFKFFPGKVLEDMVALHTAARTYIHGGKSNICLPQWETYN